MAHDAEEHAPGLLCRTGSRKRSLEFRHVLGRLFVLDGNPTHFGALGLDYEDIEEAVADEAAQRIIWPEWPDDLKDNGKRHRQAEQEDHHVPLVYGITAAT